MALRSAPDCGTNKPRRGIGPGVLLAVVPSLPTHVARRGRSALISETVIPNRLSALNNIYV